MLIKVKIPKGFLCNAIEEKNLVPQEPFSEQFFKKNLSVKNILKSKEHCSSVWKHLCNGWDLQSNFGNVGIFFLNLNKINYKNFK